MNEAMALATLVLLAPVLIKFIDKAYTKLKTTQMFKDINADEPSK